MKLAVDTQWNDSACLIHSKYKFLGKSEDKDIQLGMRPLTFIKTRL